MVLPRISTLFQFSSDAPLVSLEQVKKAEYPMLPFILNRDKVCQYLMINGTKLLQTWTGYLVILLNVPM